MRHIVLAVALVAVLASYVAATMLVHRTTAADPAVERTAHAQLGSSRPGTVQGDTTQTSVTIDTRRQQMVGVRTVRVLQSPLEHSVRAVGLVRYDETSLVDVNMKVDGWIQSLAVNSTGQQVSQGQPLLSLYSPELLTLETEYLQALKTQDQIRQSAPDSIARADALVATARRRLELLDMPAAEINQLDESRRVHNDVTFVAPVNGVVIEKQAVKGLHVTAGQSLFKVADLSIIWVEADVYESELSSVHVGTPATVTVDASPGQSLTGRIVFIYPYLDEKTRSNKVRIQFPNRGGQLKPGMYAHVALKVGAGSGLVVPVDAVLDSGTEQVVFVALGDGRFESRRVRVGRRLGDAVQVLDGVKEGESVATGAAFFLDSESQLRSAFQDAPQPGGPIAPADTRPLEIVLRTVPDPPQASDNHLLATVRDPGGKPVDDADVSVQFFMPPMPSMNMPAMKSVAKLARAGGGVYQGTGQIMMPGRWDATVTVTRDGLPLGSKRLSLVAQ